MRKLINLYLVGNTNYEENGDYNLVPIDAEYDSGEINEFEKITIYIPIDEDGLYEFATNGCVIKCNTPAGENFFKIWNTESDSKSNEKILYGYQIGYDLNKQALIDLNNDDITICETGNVNGETALNKALYHTSFKGHSNLSYIHNVRWQNKKIGQALWSSDDNSYLNTWGGELYSNKFDIYMNDHIGHDNNVVIAYGKDIDNVNEKVDNTSIITRYIYKGYDGLRGKGKTPWVDSPIRNNYKEPHDEYITFDDIKVKNDMNSDGYANEDLAIAQMVRRCNAEFAKGIIDRPKVNIQIDMNSIQGTEEYDDYYNQLEFISKGDTVYCEHYLFKVQTKARCLHCTWNIITERMTTIEIGNVNSDYFKDQKKYMDVVDHITDDKNNIKGEYLNGVINAENAKFKASRDLATQKHVFANLYEDNVTGSPTYGATLIGSQGLSLASKKTPDGREWDWRTFIKGGYAMADWLIGNLRTVLIENSDGTFQIDLKNAGGCNFLNNKKLALSIANNAIDFFNWGTNGNYIGSLGSTTRTKEDGTVNPDGIPALEMWHKYLLSFISFGYRKNDSDSISAYLRMDKGKLSNKHAPIEFFEDIAVTGNLDARGFWFYLDREGAPKAKLTTATDGGVWCASSFTCQGDLGTKGSKHCIQETLNFGNVPFYATEDLDSYLTWTTHEGEYLYTKKSVAFEYYRDYELLSQSDIDEMCKEDKYQAEEYKNKNNEVDVDKILKAENIDAKRIFNCIIKIPQIAQEGINTCMDYDVIYYKYGRGDIWTSQRTSKFFIVHSDRPLKFRCSIRGFRKSFEDSNIDNTLKNSEKQLKEKANKLNIANQQKIAGKSYAEYGKCIEE